MANDLTIQTLNQFTVQQTAVVSWFKEFFSLLSNVLYNKITIITEYKC